MNLKYVERFTATGNATSGTHNNVASQKTKLESSRPHGRVRISFNHVGHGVLGYLWARSSARKSQRRQD